MKYITTIIANYLFVVNCYTTKSRANIYAMKFIIFFVKQTSRRILLELRKAEAHCQRIVSLC